MFSDWMPVVALCLGMVGSIMWICVSVRNTSRSRLLAKEINFFPSYLKMIDDVIRYGSRFIWLCISHYFCFCFGLFIIIIYPPIITLPSSYNWQSPIIIFIYTLFINQSIIFNYSPTPSGSPDLCFCCSPLVCSSCTRCICSALRTPGQLGSIHNTF